MVLGCNNGELRGETEELYEEYIYEGDYEEYRFRCQKCGREKKSAKTRNDRSIDETLFQKFLNRKWWFLCMIRLNPRIKNRHIFFLLFEKNGTDSRNIKILVSIP